MAEYTLSTMGAAAVAFSVAAWSPRPMFEPARVAFATREFSGVVVTTAEPDAEASCMIVLARPEDFDFEGADPEWWKPGRLGNFGVARAAREIAWGTVLSMDRGKAAPTGAEADPHGLLLAGTVGDQTETLSVRCDVMFLRPEDEPDTGDLFTVEGRTWCIYRVDIQSESDSGKEMTVTGIRWNRLTQSFAPAGFTPPANWT
jgi:hypothetical protein